MSSPDAALTLPYESAPPKYNSAVFILVCLAYFTHLTTFKQIKNSFQKGSSRLKRNCWALLNRDPLT